MVGSGPTLILGTGGLVGAAVASQATCRLRRAEPKVRETAVGPGVYVVPDVLEVEPPVELDALLVAPWDVPLEEEPLVLGRGSETASEKHDGQPAAPTCSGAHDLVLAAIGGRRERERGVVHEVKRQRRSLGDDRAGRGSDRLGASARPCGGDGVSPPWRRTPCRRLRSESVRVRGSAYARSAGPFGFIGDYTRQPRHLRTSRPWRCLSARTSSEACRLHSSHWSPASPPWAECRFPLAPRERTVRARVLPARDHLQLRSESETPCAAFALS